VVASLVPVAVNFARDTEPSFNFAVVTELSTSLAVVTVPSVGVPILNTSPNTVIKSMESVPVKAEANTISEPDIV
jgi:hypothetical protein